MHEQSGSSDHRRSRAAVGMNILKCYDCRVTYASKRVTHCRHCGKQLGDVQQARYVPPPPPSLVGEEIERIVGWAKYFSSNECGCERRRQTLNRWSIETCEKNRNRIVCMMEAGAKELGLPFIRLAAERVVSVAIRRAKRRIEKQAACRLRL